MNKTPMQFERIEKKYLLDPAQKEQLLRKLEGRLLPDDFGSSRICNLYLDTEDHLLIRRSLEKPVYKEKIRLRSYGLPEEGDMVYLEIKKKFRGIVYKRRVRLTMKEAMDYIVRGIPPQKENQIMREIDWFLKIYQPVPKAVVCYDRSAWQGIGEKGLRFTFDEDIRYREIIPDLSRGDWGIPLLEKGMSLMEIKIPGSMPLWLSETLAALGIYPLSFSKVGQGYLLERAYKNEREAALEGLPVERRKTCA